MTASQDEHSQRPDSSFDSAAGRRAPSDVAVRSDPAASDAVGLDLE